jgi:hypothetical protein
MSNVVMLNFSYDVPVKIYSSILLLMAIFLAAPDVRRLADFFVFQRTVEAKPLRPANKWLIALRTVIVAGVTIYLLNVSYQQHKNQTPGATPGGLSGIWNVETLSIDGVERPPVVTDNARWRRVAFVGVRVTVQTMDLERTRFLIEHVDLPARTLTLQERGDRTKHNVQFQKSGNTLTLDGNLKGQNVHATLRLAEEQTFLLTSRGFHWINEVPFNQ